KIIMRTKSSVGGIVWTQSLGRSGVIRRLLLILAALVLGGLPAWSPVAHAGPPKGPVINQNTNATLIIAQNTTTNFNFLVQDDAVGWSGITETTASFMTNNMLT